MVYYEQCNNRKQSRSQLIQRNAGESVCPWLGRLSLARLIAEMPCQASVSAAKPGKVNLRSRVSVHQQAGEHSLAPLNRHHRHVDLSHSFRLRVLHQDIARNSQAQRRSILQHHCRKKRQLLRTLTRRAEMETDTPSDEDAFPPATAAQSARVESQRGGWIGR